MNQNEIITLHTYRHQDYLSITVSRNEEYNLNRSEVYHSGIGENKGLYVLKAATASLPTLSNSLQIPIICKISDNDKQWTEVRRLIFSFRSGFSKDDCQSAAQDFHHDLLHPEIFQRDYCGFIINMMKIVQHRYPQILQVRCSFENIAIFDNRCVETVFRFLQESYPTEKTIEEICKALILSSMDVIHSLNTLIDKNLVEKTSAGYILKISQTDLNDQELTELILGALEPHNEGLSLTEISELLSQPAKRVEFLLRDLLRSNKVKFSDSLYFPQPTPSFSDIERLLELLDSISPQGMTPKQISLELNIANDFYLSKLLRYVVNEGYAYESSGLYYIKRLEDSEIDLVYQTIHKNSGLTCEEIVQETKLSAIVVASCVKLLLEKGDIRCEGEYYFPSGSFLYVENNRSLYRIEDFPREIIDKFYDAVPVQHGILAADLAKLFGIDGQEVTFVLDHLVSTKLLSKNGDLYTKVPITDSEVFNVVTILQSSPNGISFEEISNKYPDCSYEKLWFILRSLIADKRIKFENLLYHFFPPVTETHCTDFEIGKVLRALEDSFPLGLSESEISQMTNLGIAVVKKALANLKSRSFVSQKGGKYFSRSFQEDCEGITDLLRDVHPNGMVLADVCTHMGISYQPLVKGILQYLIDEQNLVEMHGKLYFYKSQSNQGGEISLDQSVVQVLAEMYPAGLNLEEIQKKCNMATSLGDLLTLVNQKIIYQDKGEYYYNKKFTLSDNDYNEVLKVLEAAYPNSLSTYCLSKESNLSEENVVIILRTLVEQAKVTQVENNAFIRRGSQDVEKESRWEVENSRDPTIAIITFDYSVKICLDLMMTNIRTYFRFKLGGESSIYTLGTIGGKRVVATKFAHGSSQANAISTGNATTRLLGTFSRIEHVIILGLGGGVGDTSDPSRSARLGDVVVSYPGPDNSIYFMATDFMFSEGDIDNFADSTVTYRVKRWNCLDKRLFTLAKNLYEETKDLAVFPWEEYISYGQSCLVDHVHSQNFHRPPRMTDMLSQKQGLRQSSPLPTEFEGRPRMLLGTIGAGKYLHKVDNLKEQFVERSRVIAFNDEFDHVTESIHGNCVESFMFVHGICDYMDGTGNEMWQSYAALSAAAIMKFIIENV